MPPPWRTLALKIWPFTCPMSSWISVFEGIISSVRIAIEVKGGKIIRDNRIRARELGSIGSLILTTFDSHIAGNGVPQ